MQQLHIKNIHKAYQIVLPSSRNLLGFKAGFPSSPHQSRSPYSLLSLLTSHAPRTFADAQNLLHTLFFSLTKLGQSFSQKIKIKIKMQRKSSFSLSILAFYTRTLLLPLPPLFFPLLALESAPMNLENQLHKHSSQSRGELLSPHLLPCFTTKNPYGFMVGYKEPKPRPEMDPKYFPRPIWSLWARDMQDLSSKITKINALYKLD